MMKGMVFRSPWGWMGIAESRKGLRAVILPRPTRKEVLADLRGCSGPLFVESSTMQLRAARAQILRYLQGGGFSFSLPLDLANGTPFQQRVWRALRRVPYGSLRSYQWLALRVGGRPYARAVGNAVGANPLPIVVPCHRIIAANDTLGGFSSGLSMKRRLLSLEGTLARIHGSHQS
ncbi:Methylated-DNA-[protein]-cysteine S-methyltransferase [Nitrospira sp. KM1]|nr:Methylated-DNA-[protein]-cysteine S-methyltransferase [Nitrospira sp. KM1]